MEVINLKRMKILCPRCFKKKLLQDDVNPGECYCDECGQAFIIISESTVKFK